MKRTVIVFLLLAAGVCAVGCRPDRPSNRGERAPVTFGQLASSFRQPDRIYAPFMFWFWDEPLDSGKMATMSRAMAGGGFNPGYAHARNSMVGTPDLPDSEWLHDRWFSSFAAALREADAKKSYLGYCDEYWWPGLQANGRLLKAHPELAAESIGWEEFDAQGGDTVRVPASLFSVAAERTTPPAAVKGPEVTMGRWIWHPDGKKSAQSCWLRKRFVLPGNVRKAALKITVDNEYVLYLNGRRIGEGSDWTQAGYYDVTGSLVAGENVLAVEARNLDGPFGVLAGLTVVESGGAVMEVRSDSTWLTSLVRTKGWESPVFREGGWRKAKEIAGAADAPWHYKDTESRHVPAVIRSSTLKLIGAGAPFTWMAPGEGSWRVYAFNIYHHDGLDGGKVNYVDDRLAPAYIAMALEPYAARFAGGEMGRSIPGDFLDNEGDYGWKLAWSATVEKRYEERYGRDIRLWMPLMVDLDEEGLYAKARWEWFDLVTDVYAGTFKAMTDWHERRGMYTTGHFWEEDLRLQVSADGDHLKMQRTLTVPGQDCLGKKALRVHDFKEVESVAEFGNRRAMTELMGAAAFEGTPWGTFNPPFLKQAANAVTAWGMSHIIPHGVFTTRKLTGNPWPPDWYTENPMFPYMHLWNDFVCRASYVNSCGHAAPDVLLFNPMETVWALVDADMLDEGSWSNEAGKRINAIDKAYTEAIQDLTDARVEFLIGDRYYLGQMDAKDGGLRYGDLAFRTVVLPPMDVMTRENASTLLRFARSGGRVYALGGLPAGSAESGMHDTTMKNLMDELRRCPTFTACAADTGRLLKPWLDREAPGLESPVKFLSGGFPMLQERRRIDGRDFFWLVNNTDKPQACRLLLRDARGAASVWDCEDGSMRSVSSKDTLLGSSLALVFRPYEAYWLVLDAAGPARNGPPETTPKTETVADVAGPWDVTYDPAVQPVMEHPIKPPRGFTAGVKKGLDDWSAWGLDSLSGLMDYGKDVTLGRVEGRLELDLGRVCHACELWVNGRQCGERLWGPYVFEVTDALHPGVNRIRVRVANLINNSYGDKQPSGLLGPVRIMRIVQ